MMPFNSKEAELLGHLTRRLGSDHEAEAAAARERIVQLLGRHGLNFNDYAEWLQAGAAAGGLSDPDQDGTGLRDEVARLRQEAAVLRAELAAVRAGTGRAMVVTGGDRPDAPVAAPGRRRRMVPAAVVMVLLAALPVGWLLAGRRPPQGEGATGGTPSRALEGPGADRVPAFADPTWKPPAGSRTAVVLEDGMVLSSPFASRATEQEIQRGARVTVLRQLVANGRQWAEVTSPAASGYLPIDLLELPP